MAVTVTLITGSTGFIGSHVARQAIERGERVRLLVRDPRKLDDVGVDASAPGVEVVVGDLLDPDTIGPALEGVDLVQHIAGSISMGRGDRERTWAANVDTTRNLFLAARERPIERIVYLASIFALSGGSGAPDTEDSPWLLDGFPVDYVQAKREAELFARECAAAGMPIVFAYPTFCYGPGDVYESSSALVLGFLRGRLPAYVNGGHNAIDVRDAAAGLHAAMQRGRVGERYLIGGENVTFERMFALLARITGRRAPRVKLPAGAARVIGRVADRIMSDPPLTEQVALMTSRQWYYDDARARAELGHTSRPLEETLRDAVEWFERRGMV
jgi:dihydroflavonol-4-reductase